MRALTAWLRFTVQKNPTFPISALLLMGGIYRLLAPLAGAYDPASVAATVGVIVGYELVLIGIALLVLWPRRILHESTLLIKMEGVIRFAPSFTILLLDARRDLGAMLLLGFAVAGLLILRSELVVRRMGLDVKRWERAHGIVVALTGTIGFPLLVRELLTAGALARPLATLGAAAVCLVLAPAFLFLGRGPLASERPLGSRLPLVVARGFDAVSVCALFGTALWLSDVRLEPGALAPFALLLCLGIVATASAVTADGTPGPAGWICALPALLGGALVLLGRDAVAPSVPSSYGYLLAIGLGLSIALSAFFRARFALGWARLGERVALLAAAAAPLRLLGAREAFVYGALVLGAVAATALVRKLERVFCLATAGASTIALFTLAPSAGVPVPFVVAPLTGAVLAFAAAVRFGADGVAARLGWKLVAGGAAAPLVFPLPGGFNAAHLAAIVGTLGLGSLVIRARRGVHVAALAGDLVLLLLPTVMGVVARVGDGIALVALAFLVLPLGVAIALRREAWLARMR
jgi:hypothetical protein